VNASTVLERLAGRPEKFPGALLLTGASEARLEAEAARLAAILLCAGDEGEASRECRRRAAAGMHPDLLVVQPQGVQIRIDAVREGVQFGAGKPYESARRVAIVTRADLLGVEASNALLKSLEEPGGHFHWILTTTRAEVLLPTIRSRCVAVPLAPESRPERAAAWVARGFPAEDAEELAGLSPTRPSPPARPATSCATRRSRGRFTAWHGGWNRKRCAGPPSRRRTSRRTTAAGTNVSITNRCCSA